MFPTSVIRKLARSEEMFAETQSYVGVAAFAKGPVDVDAMAAAFDALIEAHPVLGGHLERLPDGRHHIVTHDFAHPGMEVLELDDPTAENPPVYLDQNTSLFHLRVTIRDGQAQPTLYIHHSLADGHHQFSLVQDMFSWYTDLVSNGTMPQVAVEAAPEPLEAILAQRGVHKGKKSGLERFMPAMFAYDLPPSRRAAGNIKAGFPQAVPMVYCMINEQRTEHLIDYCRANKIGLNALISAVVLLAEWQIRGTPSIPVPYVYPVDLRYVLSPPLSATACTNPVGVATYLAEIDTTTSVDGLARDIAETFRADLADGTIQQSMLHFSPQYVGNPPGLPDVVMLTDNGLVPSVRTPPGVELTECRGELYFAVDAGIDMYTSKLFVGQLMIEHHSHAAAPEESVEVIDSLLVGIADQQAVAKIS